MTIFFVQHVIQSVRPTVEMALREPWFGYLAAEAVSFRSLFWNMTATKPVLLRPWF